MYKSFICLLIFSSSLSYAEQEEKLDVEKISEAMGHLIGKNLQSLGLSLDIEAIVKGMQDESEGKSAPLNEDECLQALASIQEKRFTQIAKENLKAAQDFLEKNSRLEGVKSLEAGKLQYKIVKSSEGQPVQDYNSPLIRFTGKYIDGTPFTAAPDQELISLEETIPGLSKGIVGMHEGETRKIYVHPELGYGMQGHLQPNALLIFEVEVLKADASSEAHSASNLDGLPKQLSDPADTR